MTTIACDRKRMAFDTRTVEDTKCWPANDKVVRIGPALVGCAGDDGQIQQFLKWMRKPRSKPPELNDIVAMALRPDGIWHYRNGVICTPVDTAFFAIGSGEGYAIGAMEEGATPKRAVEVAAKWDPNTGHPVLVLEL